MAEQLILLAVLFEGKRERTFYFLLAENEALDVSSAFIVNGANVRFTV